MFKSKQIKLINERLEDLEKRLNSLFSLIPPAKTELKSTISYEEVITEWLCGKETAMR